jgi:hypothetical protein
MSIRKKHSNEAVFINNDNCKAYYSVDKKVSNGFKASKIAIINPLITDLESAVVVTFIAP